jgi:hypothetical protein
MTTKPKRTPREVLFRVEKGALVPLDDLSRAELKRRAFRVGDVLRAELKKARNPDFHRLMHAFARLVSENIDAFSGLDAHSVLKRLQIESGIGCDEMGVMFPGIGPCTYRIPRSLSFASMDEGEFRDVSRAFAAYVARTYWKTCTPEEIEQMANCMPEVA